MDYSVQHNSFIITQKDLQNFSLSMKYIMKSIRKELGYPIGRRKHDGGLEPIDHIEREILDACKRIGIDFGAEWGHQLDLSDVEG